jgi:hypothetical protein
MKYYIFAGLAVALIAGVIGSAPQANAGCQYGGIALNRCDGPIQPDGTWQRCVLFNSANDGSSNYSCLTNAATGAFAGPRLPRPTDVHR